MYITNFHACNFAILPHYKQSGAVFSRILPQSWLLWILTDPWHGQLRVPKMAARICPLGIQGGSNFGQKLAKKGPKISQNGSKLHILKNWASFSLSPPQNWAEHPKLHIICHQLYISSIRNAKIRAMESNIPNGAILAIWRSKWRHINFRWRFVLGQVSVDTYWQLLQSFEKFRFWDWKIGLYPVPSVKRR